MTWEPADNDGWERSSLEFAFYHSLVDADPALASPALEALGRVVASWSRLEHHIDALIVQINKPDHSQSLFEKNHPASFGNKVKLLKKWFNRYPPIASYTEDMRWLTSRLKMLADDDTSVGVSRNVLLHSIPASFDADTQTLVLHHMKMVGGNIHSRHINVPLAQMRHFAEAVQTANKFLSTITQELFTPEGYERLQKRE
ncbi:hypothetical protein [Chelativorans salis]|uniref:Uncharacterized protein n=1 Tax=Chelativorans salis TaxID=2978478 RepID=A0ABT2LG39_9HYPH|nr:hypothetical protein [Chelativorans sp. EGI FJ00035]MCT7373436.1 hypothetical protein [Chelativorans sp. EGI FJ00035]